MPVLWNSKVTFVSVSQFVGLALCSPFVYVCGPFLTPHLIVSLRGRKKMKKKKKREENKISLLLTLNPFSEFCWSSWIPQEEGGWASLFSLPMVLQGWGPGLGHNTHSCPGSGLGLPQAARLKSATHSLSTQCESTSGAWFQLRHSVSGHAQLKSPLGQASHRSRAHYKSAAHHS